LRCEGSVPARARQAHGQSFVGQPLVARIELLSSSKEECGHAVGEIADPSCTGKTTSNTKACWRARVTLERGTGDTAFLKVTSGHPSPSRTGCSSKKLVFSRVVAITHSCSIRRARLLPVGQFTAAFGHGAAAARNPSDGAAPPPAPRRASR
jgi:hypothetical protein